MATEQLEYQADAKQLLDLVIHSLYTNREIFLRELISNAADALDRLRFEALTRPELWDDGDKMEIRLDMDPSLRTVTVSDTGIGMSREEVVTNIGTIARSGAAELARLASKAGGEAMSVIGHFGVGFYSAFMVADKVTLTTLRAGEQRATRWESAGDGTFTVDDGTKATRGTEITLHLKAPDPERGIDDFCDWWRLATIVKRHSDFISYPIVGKRTIESDEPADGGTRARLEEQVLNSRTSIWKLPASEVTDEQYNDFYQHISHDWEKPLAKLLLKAEGVHEYQALLFVPSRAEHDLYFHATTWGLRLLANTVSVIDRCQELLPRYLRFVKGAVFCTDIPLNVSRQRLQQDALVGQMRKWLTKKILGALEEMAVADPACYGSLWTEFGRCLKEGVVDDYPNRERILPLMRFASSHHPETLTTLNEYIERMKPGQEQIYYLTGESRSVLETSPHLEELKERELEVLYLTDGVDELITQTLHEFNGKKLKSAGKGDLSFDDPSTDGSAHEWVETQARYAGLLSTVETALERYVRSVRLTRRLKHSAACLVVGDGEYSPSVERILGRGKGMPPRRRVLELNPDHPIVVNLLARFAKDPKDPEIANQAELLLGAASLAEGSELPNREEFGRLLYTVMERAASLPE
jgi:molecular chaperone HtpG